MLAMSRRKRRVLWFAALAVFAAAVWFDHSFFSRSVEKTQNSKERIFEDVCLFHRKRFRVIRVVDGDTVDIGRPFSSYKSTRVRLLGVDTPETENSPAGEMYFGEEASKFTRKMVLNKTVTVILDKEQKSRDTYGRVLAYLQLEDGRILNAELISEGMAYKDIRFRHQDFEKYLELESLARKNRKGLWQEVTTEQLPQWLRRLRPGILPD